MTVKELMNILSLQEEGAEVMIEYMPRAHEYITEYVLGARCSDDIVVLMGITEMGD